MEKRAYGRRAVVDVAATIQSGCRRHPARVVDLGIGGMALETEPTVELERFLRIRVRLSPDAPPLDVDALVRRREKRRHSVRWGVELVDPSPAALARIEACLDRHDAPKQQVATATDGARAVDSAALCAAEDAELRGLFQSALASLGH